MRCQMAANTVKILVADDEEMFGQFLHDILSRSGYSPDVVARGDDALAKIAAKKYDIILTDIRMPGATGFDVLKAAKERDDYVQVIVISAYGDSDNILEALRKGASDFLPKPIESPSLIPSIIERTWEKRKLLVENRELTAHLAKRNKELEEALDTIKKQQEELVHLERRKVIGTMSSGIAHEINNPLAFISTNIQSLEKYVKNIEEFILERTEDKEKFAKIRTDLSNLLSGIRNGVTRVSQITMALRAFSRRESTALQDVSLNDCVIDAVNLMRPRLREYKYEVNLAENPPNIRSNRQNIVHAIMNFIENSCYAMQKTPAPLLDIRTVYENGTLALSVVDNGAGITKDVQNKIFDPFFTTKPVGKGTGLGLSIALGVIEESGGRITFESQPGMGTEVRVEWKVN